MKKMVLFLCALLCAASLSAGSGKGDDVYGKLTIGDAMMVRSERMATAVERKNMCWYRTDVHVEPTEKGVFINNGRKVVIK